ncbi:MAG: NAD-dependent epimerase/dehydratase family protein [Gammaproteobacteria bacterium]|nr:NAD-dependent epimerase/dehydratase family protein [Gammaproteobacteria bacterium]MCF6230079.1 NAD-dependent epimerase/dehydratase family protein [Gammaproteobacteria bacterium]
MKALVLGGNGFIGSHIVDHLLAQGHSVRVFDRGVEKFRAPLTQVDYRLSPFDDVPALAEALEGIDVVYHLISTTVPSTSNKDPVYDTESNLVGTIKLLNLVRDSSVSRIVYLSSGGTVYGIPEHSPISESHPLRPICSYGVVKVAVENYLQMYHHLYGIEYAVLRVSNPYGERQGHAGVQGVIGTFMAKVVAGESIEVWGDGSVVRDFIYIKDLAKLCEKVGHSHAIGVFNAGSGQGCSIQEIVATLSTVTEQNIQPKYSLGRSYDVPKVVLNIAKAKGEFEWNPEISLLDGMAKTWGWVRAQVK